MIIVLGTVKDQRQEQAVDGIRSCSVELQGPSQTKLIDRGTKRAKQVTMSSFLLLADLG
jgi:hypothetical protein